MLHWTARENSYLWNRGDSVPVAVLAERLGRSEAAVRKQLQRLKIHRRRKATFSEERLARELGFHRSVIRRVAKEHGQRWLANGRQGNGVRYSITENQAKQIKETLIQTQWSRKYDQCFGCGTNGQVGHQKHHAHGLCRRCYVNGYFSSSTAP